MSVITPNPIQSVFWLVLSFLISSALLITLKLDFIPLIIIIVYVGAIVILFLFVVMMLEVIEYDRTPIYNTLPILIFFSVISTQNLFIRLNVEITENLSPYVELSFNASDHLSLIGGLIYTTYILPFVTLTILLLVGLVGVILLALENGERKKQQLNIQQKRNNSWI